MKQLLIIISLGICWPCQAQLPDYYVYLVTGKATITKAGANPVVIKQNQLVYKSDVIVLKSETEVTLVDKNANFIVLKTAGSYKASELIKKATTKNTDGITSKYLKLLFHELLDPTRDYEKFKKENIAGTSAGVSRDPGCGNRIYPVNGSKTASQSIVFRWHMTSPSSNYMFFIYDGEGNEQAKKTTKDTMLVIDIKDIMQGKSGKYFWRLKSVDGKCEDEFLLAFEILTPEKEKEQTAQLIASIGSETLVMQLQQIDKLEKNAFIDAAISSYASLVKANPGNDALMKSYVLFLLKYGFGDEAKTAWMIK